MLLADFIRDGAARLEKLYPSPEARGLVLMLCRELLGVTNYTHIVEPQTAVPEAQLPELTADLERLCAGEPIQYVLGVAEFCDRRFAVGPGVLVPRPETELLVAEAVRTLQEMDLERAPRVLDLCTGSGCIAWSIALDIRDAEVIGLDLSERALGYARNQFGSSGLVRQSPEFLQADVLDTEQDFPYGPFDLIVSNPPYVLERERAQMRPNVLDWEPGLALFAGRRSAAFLPGRRALGTALPAAGRGRPRRDQRGTRARNGRGLPHRGLRKRTDVARFLQKSTFRSVLRLTASQAAAACQRLWAIHRKLND